MKKLMNPRLLLIASMAIFGTLGPFVRNIPVSSGELALYRAVLAAILIAAFLLVTKQKIPFSDTKREGPRFSHPAWQWASTGYSCLKLIGIRPYRSPR